MRMNGGLINNGGGLAFILDIFILIVVEFCSLKSKFTKFICFRIWSLIGAVF